MEGWFIEKWKRRRVFLLFWWSREWET